MSSGGYDGLHSSSSYGHGDSWRPSGSSGYGYDSSNFYATRRRTPSPSRRYVPHNGYYPSENSYRPSLNSYRPDEDAAYYSRSPSPDPYARAYPRPLERPLEPDAWDRPPPWTGIPASPWDDHPVGPASPTSSTSKARGSGMPATRTFEPSDAWKQNHFDRPLSIDTMRRLSMDWYIGDPSVPRTPNPYIAPSALGTPSPYGTSSAHPIGDRYRPAQPHREPTGFVPRVSDSYRPGWSPDGKPDARKFSGTYTQGRRVSGTGSKIGSSSPHRSSPYGKGRTLERRSRSRSRRSSSGGRRSYSRSSSRSLSRGRRSSSRNRRSRSRHRRSVSRGRRSVSRDRRSANLGNSSSSPGKRAPPVKYSWDRPSKVSSVTSSSKSGAAAQPLQKSSWTRSASRSSIASTQASEKAPSPPPKPQPASLSQSSAQKAITTQDIERDSKQQANIIDAAGAPPLAPTVISAASSQVNVIMTDETVKTYCYPPAPDLPQPDAVLPHPSKPALETTTVVPLPSPPQPKSIPALVHPPAAVNGTANSTASNTGVESVGPKTEDHSEKAVVPPLSLHDTPSRYPALADAHSALAPIENNVEPSVDIPLQGDSRPHSPQQVATSLPTPQPRLLPRSPPSPPVPENIPTEAKSTREALRIVVMTRLLCDRQTREERVNPVILSNLSLAAQVHQERPSAPEEVIKEVVEGPYHENMMENFARMKPSLMERFKERQTLLAEKVRRLREEYLSLHERWVAHCAALDAQSQAAAPAAEIIQPSGRTTRRSIANLGDAVRSDLEMEQIIASLGNDDATDPNHLSLRNLANVPDMISVTKGKVDYLFDDTNQLVENPNQYYGPYTGIDDWTDQEKEIFLDKFAAHPKQFGMIAEHLPNKTAAQCVDYYYLHKKKLINFRKVISQYAPNKRKRRGTGKKKGNGLLADIRQHDAEVHGELGSPKTVGRPRGRKAMAPPEPKEPKKSAASRRRNQLDLTPSMGSATPTPEPESRRRGRRSTAAPSSRTVSVSLDDGEEDVPEEEPERPAKRAKRTRKVKSAAIVVEEPSTPEPKPLEQTEPVSRRKSGSSSAQWSEEDKSLFLTLLGQYGDDFKRIAASMPNKTTIQVSNYYKVNVDELDLARVAAGAPKRSPTPEAQGSRTEAPLPVSDVATTTRGTTPDPMSSLAPDLPHMGMNGTPSITYQEASRPDLYPKHLPTWSSTLSVRNRNDPFASSSSSRAPSPSQVRGYPYPAPNGRPPAPYPPHTMPSAYPTHPPVPYTYAPYSGPRYPQYDATIPPHPHPLARIPHPYSMADPLSAPGHQMSPAVLQMRGREGPYPLMQPPGHPSYHYSLESS